jgi:hypothetical protein
MQESTLRRSACSGVMTLAGAPSWVRGRGLVDLKTFRRTMRLLSVFKKILPGKSRARTATPDYYLAAGFEPAPLEAKHSG